MSLPYCGCATLMNPRAVLQTEWLWPGEQLLAAMNALYSICDISYACLVHFTDLRLCELRCQAEQVERAVYLGMEPAWHISFNCRTAAIEARGCELL